MRFQVDHIAKRSHKLFIFGTIIAFALFFVWGAYAKLEKVTRGSGQIIPSELNQMVQHFEGGILTALLVKEGDHVESGDVLMRIENDFNQAELQQTKFEMRARLMRLFRLNAELEGKEFLDFPIGLADGAAELVNAELDLFLQRQTTKLGQLNIFDNQIRQKKLELDSFQVQLEGKQQELVLVREQLASNKRLLEMGAVSRSDVLRFETAENTLLTAIDRLKLDIPKTESSLEELSQRREDMLSRMRETIAGERSEVQVQINKLEQALQAMTDRKQRTDVRAPISGTVNSVFVTTIGAVVRSGQNLVQIVPSQSAIEIEAKVSPKDRAEIWPGLPAVIKVTAYDFSTYGGLQGEITEISPDALQDQQGVPYFRVRLKADVSNFGDDKPVVPGMQAEVDILTGERTVLEYLLTPIRLLQENSFK